MMECGIGVEILVEVEQGMRANPAQHCHLPTGCSTNESTTRHIFIIWESITTTNANNYALQVLAVDLLNPSAATEAKKHKLKVRPSKQTILFRPTTMMLT